MFARMLGIFFIFNRRLISSGIDEFDLASLLILDFC